MYSKLQIAFKYLSYYFSSANSKGHGTHSPFIFHFITKVLNDRDHYPGYDKVSELHNLLSADHTLLEIDDLGAGSAIQSANTRSVSSILQNAAKPAKFGRLFYRMAQMYKPSSILELGTSLGISAAYFALGNPLSKLTTIEGASPVASLARANLAWVGAMNASVITGSFDDTLPSILSQHQVIDMIFVDGNHRRAPTERYFLQLLEVTGNDTIMIFDDIHWSKEMEAAWTTIRNHPAVTTSVDLFFIGIVFFRREFLEKQSFTIRF